MELTEQVTRLAKLKQKMVGDLELGVMDQLFELDNDMAVWSSQHLKRYAQWLQQSATTKFNLRTLLHLKEEGQRRKTTQYFKTNCYYTRGYSH